MSATCSRAYKRCGQIATCARIFLASPRTGSTPVRSRCDLICMRAAAISFHLAGMPIRFQAPVPRPGYSCWWTTSIRLAMEVSPTDSGLWRAPSDQYPALAAAKEARRALNAMRRLQPLASWRALRLRRLLPRVWQTGPRPSAARHRASPRWHQPSAHRRRASPRSLQPRRPRPPRPLWRPQRQRHPRLLPRAHHPRLPVSPPRPAPPRSEEHTSELQSLAYLVCRLLLEKKKTHQIELLQKKKKKTRINQINQRKTT